MTNKLTPLLANTMAIHRSIGRPLNPQLRQRQVAIEVIMYECPICGERHDDEEDAEECCASVGDGESKADCPICGNVEHDHHAAADCCLWKSFDAPTRWRMADAVEAGSTWDDEIRKATQ